MSYISKINPDLKFELENDNDFELGPLPKFTREERIPKKEDDEDEEDDKILAYLKKPHSAEYLALSEKLSNAGTYEEFCSTLVEMKDLYDCETSSALKGYEASK